MKAQGVQGLSKNYRESASPLSCLIRDFRNKYNRSLNTLWEDQYEWHIITRMAGPDCTVMSNLINTHTRPSEIELANKTVD